MQPSPPEPRQRPGLRAPLQPRQRGPRARTLDDLGSLYCKIRVDCTRGGPVEARLSACPDPHEPLAPGFTGAPQDPVVASVVLQSPAHADDHQVHELLTWFSSAAETGAGDDHAVLALPASCTKGQRAVWHRAAERVGLHSESMGFGDGRYLQIYSRAAWCRVRAAAAGAHTQGQVQTQAEARRGRGGDRELGARVKQLWRWCQAEGLFNYSQGELQQLLAGGAQLPPDVAAVVEKRNVAARLIAALNAADEAAALAAVGEDPTACWVRDDATGGYPAHVAAFFGLERALRAMVAANAPTLLEQRDARRMTPLGVAREAGRAGAAAAIVDILKEAGLAAASPGQGEDRVRSRGTGAPGRASRSSGPAGTGCGRGREQQDGQAQGAADAAADCARPPRSAVARATSPEPLASRPPTVAPGSPPTPPPQPLLPTAGERGFTRQRTASPRVAGVLAAASTAVLTKPPPSPEEPVRGVAQGGKAHAVMVRLEVQPNVARPVELVLQVVQPSSKNRKQSGVHVSARLFVSEALPGHPRPVRLVINVVGSTEKPTEGRALGSQDLAHDGRCSTGARKLHEPLQGGTQAQGRGQRQAHQRRQSGQHQQHQRQQQQQQQQQPQPQQQQQQQQLQQAFEQQQQQQQQQYAWAMYQQQMQLMGMGGGQVAMAAATGVTAPTPPQRAARPNQGQQHQQFTYANPSNQRQVDQAQYMQHHQQQQQQQLYQLYLQQQQFYVQHQAVYAQQQQPQQQQPQHAGQPLYTYQQPRSHQQKAQGHSRRKHANGDGGRQ